MFDLLLLRPAVRFLEQGDLGEVRRLLDLIAEDPFWDHETKFPFQAPPVVVSLCESGRFQIVYRIINSATIELGWAGQSFDSA